MIAVSLGNALEYYDFTIYALFAIQIGATFFPSHDPQTSLLASLATFGAGFLSRPLGALVIGRMGDRRGRGPAMVLSMALMGFAIALLVLCPGYDRIGYAAPAIAVTSRLIQGFALGGEVGPTTAYMLEWAPLHRRGLYVSLQRATQLLANMAGALAGMLLAALLSAEAFADYGWRIAVGLGAVIAPYAVYARRNMPEPEAPAPHLDDTLASQRNGPVRAALVCLFAGMGGTISAYVLNYMTTLGQSALHLSPTVALTAQAIGCAVGIGAVFCGAALSDRWGRRPLILGGYFIAAVLVPIAFGVLLEHPGPQAFIVATSVVSVLLNLPNAVIITVMAESFPHRVRSLATSLAYTMPVTIFGGSTQFVVAWLTGITGTAMVVAWYASGALLIGCVAVLFLRETAPARLGHLDSAQPTPSASHV